MGSAQLHSTPAAALAAVLGIIPGMAITLGQG